MVVIVLLSVFFADRQAPALAAEQADENTASLVLTYEFEDDLHGEHYAWFVDTLGRRFSFSASCDDPLDVAPPTENTRKGAEEYFARKARTDGSIEPKQVARLVAESEPLGAPLPRKDVDHLLTLVAASRRVPVRKVGLGCIMDGFSIRIRAYSPESSGSSFVTLWKSDCDKVTLENRSSAARELVKWVLGHAGVFQGRGRFENPLPWKAPDAEPPPRALDLAKKESAELVNSERPRTIACYQEALKTNPELRGRIDMSWTIDTNGAPRDIKVDSYLFSPTASSVPECLRAIIAKWRFRKACPNSEGRAHWEFPPP